MIVGITGYKYSGKDTAAKALRGFINLKMADPLKDMLRTMYRAAGYSDCIIERKLEGDMKEHPCSLLKGQTPRHAMQTLGTEWRLMVQPDLWLDIWLHRADLMRFAGEDVVCTDVRFHREAEAIREMGGTLIRVVRPGNVNSDPHPSEKEIPEIAVDLEIINDGTVEDMHRKIYDYFSQRH